MFLVPNDFNGQHAQVLPQASPSPCYAQRALLVFAASATLFSGATLAALKSARADG
jgi:hypothetical protein